MQLSRSVFSRFTERSRSNLPPQGRSSNHKGRPNRTPFVRLQIVERAPQREGPQPLKSSAAHHRSGSKAPCPVFATFFCRKGGRAKYPTALFALFNAQTYRFLAHKFTEPQRTNNVRITQGSLPIYCMQRGTIGIVITTPKSACTNKPGEAGSHRFDLPEISPVRFVRDVAGLYQQIPTPPPSKRTPRGGAISSNHHRINRLIRRQVYQPVNNTRTKSRVFGTKQPQIGPKWAQKAHF